MQQDNVTSAVPSALCVGQHADPGLGVKPRLPHRVTASVQAAWPEVAGNRGEVGVAEERNERLQPTILVHW